MQTVCNPTMVIVPNTLVPAFWHFPRATLYIRGTNKYVFYLHLWRGLRSLYPLLWRWSTKEMLPDKAHNVANIEIALLRAPVMLRYCHLVDRDDSGALVMVQADGERVEQRIIGQRLHVHGQRVISEHHEEHALVINSG